MSDPEASGEQFAIRVGSMDQLFWEFDARPVAERTLAADVRWSLVDEWERLRNAEPSHLTIYAPESDRASTDEGAVRDAIRTSLRRRSPRPAAAAGVCHPLLVTG